MTNNALNPITTYNVICCMLECIIPLSVKRSAAVNVIMCPNYPGAYLTFLAGLFNIFWTICKIICQWKHGEQRWNVNVQTYVIVEMHTLNTKKTKT